MTIAVNGETISDERIEAELDALKRNVRPNPQGQGPTEDQLLERVKEQLIIGTLIVQEVKKRDIRVSPKEVTGAMAALRERNEVPAELPEEQEEQFRESVLMRLRIDKLVDTICADLPEVTESDAQAAYEENKERFAIPERLHASHIVKHVQGDNIIERTEAFNALKEAQNRMAKGESFEAIADEHSDCPGSGGDLGTFPRGEMVQEFEDVVFPMEEGEISGIFSSPFGLHIAKVHKRFPAEVRPFDEVKEDIIKNLSLERENAKIDEFVDQLRAAATIEDDA